MAPEIVLALTTEADQARAQTLARHLVEHGLASCVSLWPQHTLYRWGGEICEEAEVELLIKTDGRRLEACRRAVHQLHGATTPQWIHWRAEASGAYGNWVLGGRRLPTMEATETPNQTN